MRKILENSCGGGNVLAVIVTMYIEDCLSIGHTTRQIQTGLESDIFGVEIDKVRQRWMGGEEIFGGIAKRNMEVRKIIKKINVQLKDWCDKTWIIHTGMKWLNNP